MGYKLRFSKYALKDAKKLEECRLDKKTKEIWEVLKENPY
jgi:mRNA-degrading endonuclease RelE of RelBE toxin-antitoxin system